MNNEWIPDFSAEELEQLVQFTCRRCLGETWLRAPFAPKFCAHCGVELMEDRIQIAA